MKSRKRFKVAESYHTSQKDMLLMSEKDPGLRLSDKKSEIWTPLR